ncbi:MAG: radical SAM protein [Clostridia bacterium]|nr:radical SAM protein [Clostridia bacterium]
MKLINEVFIGSLTGKSELEQRNILEKFREDNRHDKVKVAIIPNEVNKEFLKMLKEYDVGAVELEVQSTNSYILKKCGYEYTMQDIKKASKMIKWKGFKVSFQVGIGLPESNKIDELNTAKDLAKLRPNLVRIYPMVVVTGTGLETEFNEGRYEPLTLNQAIERCKEEVYAFNRKKVKQINIVKQNELNKSEETELIARSISRRLRTACNR